MRKISFVSSTFEKNSCFEVNGPYNRDGFLNFFVHLKREFLKRGYDLSTSDVNIPSCSQAIIFNESPKNIKKYISYSHKYLLYLESSLVNRLNNDKLLHNNYKKIFTWNDDLIDNQLYFKANYAFELPDKIDKRFKDKKLVCVISAHKKTSFSNELYSEREKAIKWYQVNAPDDFDLYGIGWDLYKFSIPVISKILNRILPIKTKEFSSYRGKVESKNQVLKNYKFTICYENIYGDRGYITEKIFDAFVAGCVPIYLGAPNINEHIPKECFVDKRNFEDYSELHDYLQCMPEDEYLGYLNAIDSFFKSARSTQFRAENFAKNIVDEVLKDVGS